MKQKYLQSILEPIKAISKLIKHTKSKGIIIGGVASSLLGKPRFTADVDVLMLIDEDNISGFIEEAISLGLIPRILDVVAFAQKNRVILLEHKKSNINVDISLGLLPFEKEAIDRSKVLNIEGIKISLPAPEDLIILKAVAHRPIDIEDIRMIVTTHRNLDVKRIKKFVEEFARVLEMPELWNDISHFFTAKNK